MKPDLGTVKPSCGACGHWLRIKDSDAGECCALPAQALVVNEGDGDEILFLRPQMADDERACMYFSPNQ